MADRMFYQKPRKKSRLGCLILIILLVAVGGGLFYVKSLLEPVDEAGAGRLVRLNIAGGSGATEISQQLYENGLIRNRHIFYWYALYQGSSRELQSGKYIFSTEQSVPEIMENLLNGAVEELSFTIPEGYNLQQITELLAEKGLIDKDEFVRLLTEGNFSYDFLPEINQSEGWLEGYLFPETYLVNESTTEKAIINLLLNQFGKVIGELGWPGCSAETGYNLHQIVTVASMIEKEAGTEADRPLIASVIYNRMAIGMKLDLDATLIYVLKKTKLTNADIKLDSPYNTYLHSGLPPGPIASPGKASLEAALHPAKTDYYYYVLDPNTGGHVFSKTYTEHLQKVKKYLSKKL